MSRHSTFSFFFFNDTATTEIYTLSLHDALPISSAVRSIMERRKTISSWGYATCNHTYSTRTDRKSTRLNSSHDQISYAVFCLKKKKKQNDNRSSLTRLTSILRHNQNRITQRTNA